MLGIDAALLLVIATGPCQPVPRAAAGGCPSSVTVVTHASAVRPVRPVGVRTTSPQARTVGDTSLAAWAVATAYPPRPLQDSAAFLFADSAARPCDSAGPALPVSLGLAPQGVLPAAQVADPVLEMVSALADTTPRGSRRHLAVMLPDSYYTRLTIHRIGAFAMFPLFATQYVLGQKLINGTSRPHSLKVAHAIVAGTLGVVFLSNTVTGVWNLWTARHVQQGRARRIVHSVIMLASDAGLTWAAVASSRARRDLAGARTHRNIALGSMALSTVGAVMMWIWKD